MTKLGLHVNKVPSPLVPFVRDAKPRILKFLDHDLGTVRACRDASPDTILIGRFFTGDQRYDQPKQNAQTLVEKILPVADRFRGLYEAWESYNELEPQNPDEARRFSEFHVHFAEAMRAHGLKTIAYNFSTGVPKLELWQYYQDGAAASDYIGLHEYDAPTMDRIHRESLAKGEGGMYLCLRYRRVWDLLAPRARKPLIITECGIDGGVINDTYINDDGERVKKLGYKDFRRFNQITTADYMRQLQWYDDEMNKDDFVVGACVFCFGADIARWETFDLANDDDAREQFKRLLMRPQAPVCPVRTDVTVPGPIPGQPGRLESASPHPAAAKSEMPAQPVTTVAESVQPCAIAVAPWFEARYAEDAALRSALGCPTATDRSTNLAEQMFQHGLMIYRADTQQIYVLLNSGAWSVFADRWTSDQPEGGLVRAPDGLFEPRRGFGKLWREKLGGANAAIGFATATEQGLSGQLQTFERGTVIRNDRGVVRVLLANGTWQMANG